ncbi:MAG: hypothetical protein QM497_08395 [Sulfurimonas sp.]
MEISLSTWMMVAFVAFMIAGIWKIYAFLPTKVLADDDRKEEAEHELLALMLHVIKMNEGNLTPKELFFAIQEDEGFNSKLFWRFNHNRLNQLLQMYYIKNPNTNSIESIYKELNS